MSHPDHLRKLQSGDIEHWNSWRATEVEVVPNLSLADLRGGNFREADFSGADLSLADISRADLSTSRFWKADLSQANLNRANLTSAYLREADLSEVDLSGANLNLADLSLAKLEGANLNKANLNNAYLWKSDLTNADLSRADLTGANLTGADLTGADMSDADLSNAKLTYASLSGANLGNAILTNADLSRADLTGADLPGAKLMRADMSGAALIETTLTDANLSGCIVYGVSTWDVRLEGAIQADLVLTPVGAPAITVDNLEIAQFLYLLLNNKNIRHVIDTITSKVVLILGRFTPERKPILDAIRDELRKRDYLPVLFDFEKPTNRDITETVSTLAHMARFVLADLSDPKSIPHELAHVAPLLPSVPIMPLIVRPQKEYAMFEHFFGFRHVLKPLRYRDAAHLLSVLNDKVIAPAENLAQRVAGKRSRR